MSFRLHLLCLVLATTVSGCIGGHRIGPERVRRENPEFYRGWVRQLRERGMTDDDLRKWGFKDPLPPVEGRQAAKAKANEAKPSASKP